MLILSYVGAFGAGGLLGILAGFFLGESAIRLGLNLRRIVGHFLVSNVWILLGLGEE